MGSLFAVPSVSSGGRVSAGAAVIVAALYASNVAGLKGKALPGARRIQEFMSK